MNFQNMIIDFVINFVRANPQLLPQILEALADYFRKNPPDLEGLVKFLEGLKK